MDLDGLKPIKSLADSYDHKSNGEGQDSRTGQSITTITSSSKYLAKDKGGCELGLMQNSI